MINIPKEFDDILVAIKKSIMGKTNPRTGKPYTEDDCYSMAVAAYKKKYGKNPMGETAAYNKHNKAENRDWHRIEYCVPITISEVAPLKEGILPDFMVYGTAINETITRNNVKYSAEELRTATPTLKNKPILKNHWNDVDSIVGRTTENIYFDEATKSVKFEGRIMEDKYKEMIRDGRITSVSIGAGVKDLVKVETEGQSYLEAIGIEFYELSLVPVPGDAMATISQALEEAFDIKQAVEGAILEVSTQKKQIEVMPTMAEEKKEPPQTETAKTKTVETENVQTVKVQVEGFDEVRKIAEESAKMCEENKKLKEELEALKKVKEETKGKVENKTSDTSAFEGYMLEKEGAKGAIFMMPNNDGTFPKRK